MAAKRMTEVWQGRLADDGDAATAMVMVMQQQQP